MENVEQEVPLITLLGGCFKPTWVGFISIRLYFERLKNQSLSQKDIISSKLLMSNFRMAMFVGGRVRFFIRCSTVTFCDVLGMSRLRQCTFGYF